MKSKYIIILILLIIIGLFLYWYFYIRVNKTQDNTKTSTSGVTAPKYTSQMQDCEDIGGKVEKKDKNMGEWTTLDKWRCVCTEGETFSNNLKCNQWLEPEI